MLYPIADLVRDSRRSKTMVKTALVHLQQGLIRKQQGMGKTKRFFVCTPDAAIGWERYR